MTALSLSTRVLHADLDTPVSAFLKLRPLATTSFLYESVEGPRQYARYSILGVGSKRTYRVRDQLLTIQSSTSTQTEPAQDPLTAIRQAWDAYRPELPKDTPSFVGGIFGYLSYDAVRSFEPLGPKATPPDVDDAMFIEPELLAVFDNREQTLTLYASEDEWLGRGVDALRGQLPEQSPAGSFTEPVASPSREDFKASVERAKEHIRAGDIIQAVISRTFKMPRFCDPFDIYRGLRRINPSPYMYYIETPDVEIAGASPEVMVRVDEGQMLVRPIAGTRKRGENAQADQALAEELLADPKERAEHIMLVDLGRNDVGRVAVPGSVEVKDLMVIEKYSHVMHIVSEVQGQLTEEQDAFDALRASFPAGTLSGAPKVRAMQIIDDLEHDRRGIYGGAVGYFGADGNADFGIAIRTMVGVGDEFTLQAGAGIVADSDPEMETDETEHKARAVIRAARWAASPEASR